MDNVTHSLAGMLAAEAVLVWRRETRQEVRALAYLASAVANNLPDSDIVYTWITGPKPLGSLLHHRGHTHTLVFALPMAWLLGLGLWHWFKRRHADATAAEKQLFIGLALLGPVLHLTLDFGNNYGVHPFWPLSAEWFYGDTIFIVEPLWWAIAVPILALHVRRTLLKVLLWVLLFAVLLLAWFVPYVLPASQLALLGLTALSIVVARKALPRARIAFALTAWLSVAAVFAVGSRSAKAHLRTAAVAAFPALQPHDLAVTPLPANPACWEAFLAGEQGGRYRVLRASVALWPLTAKACTAGHDAEPTAGVRRLDRPDREGVHWVSEYQAELVDLRRLTRDDCRFRALLQFTRLPYFSVREQATPATAAGRFAGDLRYDRKPELDFADMQLPADPHAGECPKLLPGWTEPRRELFFQP